MKSGSKSGDLQSQLRSTRPVHDALPVASKNPRLAGIQVEIVETVEGIESLESSWRAMTSETAAPFQTFSWNLAWYRHFHAKYDHPLALVASRAGEVIAILPAYQKGPRIRLAGDISGDYQDIIAATEEEAFDSLGAIFEVVARDFPSCHFFFQKVSSEGSLSRFFLKDMARMKGSLVFRKKLAPCPHVSIRGGLETYLQSLPSKHRQDMRRALKRLDREMPTSRVEILRNLEIRVIDLQNIADFHQDHFRKDGFSPLKDSALTGLLGEVSKDPDVGLQVAALIDEGEMIAMDIGFARGGHYYGYLTGFDSAYEKWAPGKCLLLKRIDRWVEDDGVEVLDFLSGGESYKARFTLGEAYCVDSIHWMPDRIRSRAKQASLVAGNFGKQLAKTALSKVMLSR